MPYGGVCLMRSMPYEGFDCIYMFFIVRGRNAMYLPTSRFVFEAVQLRCDKRSM